MAEGISLKDLQAQIAALAAENAKLAAKLEAKSAAKVSLKVTEKGGLSMYGLGRFPVTLYRSQWERLLAHADEVKAFIEANAGKLATKD